MKKLFLLILITFIFSFASCNLKPSNKEETTTGYFKVTYDYGEIKEGEITILIDSCLPFFDFSEFGIDMVYPGDQLIIEYTGTPLIEESYPGRMTGIEVKNVELHDRIIKKVSDDEIQRTKANFIESITSNVNNLEYIITNNRLSYQSLRFYCGLNVYSLHFNDSKSESNVTSNDEPASCYISFDPSRILLKLNQVFMNYLSDSYNDFHAFLQINWLYNKNYNIIDSLDEYNEIMHNIPNYKVDETIESNEKYFDEYIIVLHRRNISGSFNWLSVYYFYNPELNSITKEYITIKGDEMFTTNFIGTCLDVIEIPREYYDKLTK